MTTEDKSQIPLFSPEDEKETQKAPDHHSTNGTLKETNKWTGFQGKTMWDWLQLLGVLAIPLVVAGATLLFSLQQANLANQQHEADKQSSLDQQQESVLKTYLDDMGVLLLKPNDLLATTNYRDAVRAVARAKTLTALRRLDGLRKGILLRFLYEALLIGGIASVDDAGNAKIAIAIVVLYEADLHGADLHDAFLFAADLHGVNLDSADLHGTDLHGTDLNSADLHGADLHGANLDSADLSDSTITQQQLDQVQTCQDAILPKGLTCHHNQ